MCAKFSWQLLATLSYRWIKQPLMVNGPKIWTIIYFFFFLHTITIDPTSLHGRSVDAICDVLGCALHCNRAKTRTMCTSSIEICVDIVHLYMISSVWPRKHFPQLLLINFAKFEILLLPNFKNYFFPLYCMNW